MGELQSNMCHENNSGLFGSSVAQMKVSECAESVAGPRSWLVLGPQQNELDRETPPAAFTYVTRCALSCCIYYQSTMF